MKTQPTASRSAIRLALPSKGRMEEETLQLLRDCGLTVNKVNPRQYIATISEFPQLEIWFQRTADVVRKVRDGDTDLGIVGFDKIAEYRGESDAVVIIHEALNYSHCRLSVAVPENMSNVSSMPDLADYARKINDHRPLRVVSKYQRQAARFLEQQGVSPFKMLYADGALEAAPQMGTADIIVDLVSSGVTLRENRLRELSDGIILRSQAMFIGNRTALSERPEVLELARDFLERFEAHLRAVGQYMVVANIRGESAEDVAQKVLTQPDLGGLQGPTISPVYLRQPVKSGWYAINIVVTKSNLHRSIAEIRRIGGSGVLVLPITYIFEEEPTALENLSRNIASRYRTHSL
jgi:ATP phosphoribosyltransferase